MVASGILDPLKVVRLALQNAASIAAMILPIATLIMEMLEHAAALLSPSFQDVLDTEAVLQTKARVSLLGKR